MEHPPTWAAEALAAFLRAQSEWREAQALRFPTDDRNRRSARALAELADHVERLPMGDTTLKELVDVGAFDERRRFIVTDDARRVAARFGFDWITTPRVLLQELARATWRARRTPAQKRTRMNAVMETGEHVLADNDRVTLSDIFSLAERQSRKCRSAEKTYVAAVAASDQFASDHRNAWIQTIADVHASIASAALARVRAFGGIDLDGKLIGLGGHDLDQFIRPIFEDAGVVDDFVPADTFRVDDLRSTAKVPRPASASHEPTLAFRRGIAELLIAALERIRTIERVSATPKHVHELEQTLLNARDNVEGIPAYAEALDKVTEFVRLLKHEGSPGMLLGQMRGGINTVLENIVPEDRIDSGTDWERRESLQRVLTSANAGDAWAVAVLEERPHVAWFDPTSKKWLEQVDSGRGPGIAAARDKIIRTRRPS